jgi:hypothetical protein
LHARRPLQFLLLLICTPASYPPVTVEELKAGSPPNDW